MHDLGRRLGVGVLGGALGLLVMELVRRATAPMIVERAPRPTDVFHTERSLSPLGSRHEADEGATEAVGRIAYEKVVGAAPSPRARKALSWAVHITYGLVVAAAYGAVRGDRGRVVRDGALFGTGLWLLGDELAVPLLGLSDKPSAYHPTRHVQALVQHLGFGVATAATTHVLEGSR